MNPPYQHIIWDWNGTLLDDAWLCVDITSGMLQRRGRPPLTLARYAAEFGFPVRAYYDCIGLTPDGSGFEEASVEFMAEYQRRCRDCDLHPGARDLLAAIQARGVGQTVLSAYRQEYLQDLTRHFGLDQYFTDLVGLDNDHAGGKQALGRAWIARQSLPAAAMLMVGDTTHDHDVAQAMGTACVLVAGGHQAPPRLERCGVPVFASLAEARETILGSLP